MIGKALAGMALKARHFFTNITFDVKYKGLSDEDEIKEEMPVYGSAFNREVQISVGLPASRYTKN